MTEETGLEDMFTGDGWMGVFAKQSEAAMGLVGKAIQDPEQALQWANAARKLQTQLLEFQAEQAIKPLSGEVEYADPRFWLDYAASWWKRMPAVDTEAQKRMWEDGLAVWEAMLGQFGLGSSAAEGKDDGPDLPRKDRRFADALWRQNPFFAVLHQSYLMACDQVTSLADRVEGTDPAKKEQLRFATQMLLDAFSPSNFPLTNPQVLQRAIETKGESLVTGFSNLLADLRRGQLTHTDPEAFKLGENIAVTPGKVVYETPLFQLIQYTPVTEKVIETPLLIFPPWINRFYILDLNAKKSFVRWAVENGITVFMVSWKSADASMADTVWDDYIASQIEAIDTVRARLKVSSVHTIGYCVAGTTLSATLAILARKGEADKVASATFFTAQVDFTNAGDLLHFADDAHIETAKRLSPQGYLDGRYMAATFNLLRSNDLLWSYVVNHYLLGQDYPAFDLLHWNGDVTNLPLTWHQNYLKDLYRDNRLVVPDSLSACGVPIDLTRIETPCYIQAGREDHISPPDSVWKLTRLLRGPWTFLLAGSGHIAGVVNPPSANKYQYWTNDGPAETLEAFVDGASEHPGSWWPHWLEWIRSRTPAAVTATGKRKPGGRGDTVIEDAPGRYVKSR